MYMLRASMLPLTRTQSPMPPTTTLAAAIRHALHLFPSVTIRFRGNTDQRMGSGPVVVWEGIAQRSSMPPQFIMMIAASSAAAGAMLLFLCLWHCVFRPVQLRRQVRVVAMGG